jgi:hypothetical protein
MSDTEHDQPPRADDDVEPRLSGRQKGQLNLDRFQRILDDLERLPSRNGSVRMTALAAHCGFDRGVLYKNERVRTLLEARARLEGLNVPEQGEAKEDGSSDADKARLEARVLKLEQRLAALSAENAELRRQLRQFVHIEEHFVQTGRRIIR